MWITFIAPRASFLGALAAPNLAGNLLRSERLKPPPHGPLQTQALVSRALTAPEHPVK